MDRGAWRASVRGGCKELDMIERLTPTHTALGSSQTLGGASAQFPPDLTAPLPRATGVSVLRKCPAPAAAR